MHNMNSAFKEVQGRNPGREARESPSLQGGEDVKSTHNDGHANLFQRTSRAPAALQSGSCPSRRRTFAKG